MDRPEDYRQSSIGYHAQTGNRNRLLSLDFGLKLPGEATDAARFRRYRRFLYEVGAIDKGKGLKIDERIVAAERENDFDLTRSRRFLYRTRYFTDSGIIGTQAFVRLTYQRVRDRFGAKRDKVPKAIGGIYGIYSLKRLTE